MKRKMIALAIILTAPIIMFLSWVEYRSITVDDLIPEDTIVEEINIKTYKMLIYYDEIKEDELSEEFYEDKLVSFYLERLNKKFNVDSDSFLSREVANVEYINFIKMLDKYETMFSIAEFMNVLLFTLLSILIASAFAILANLV